MISTLQEYYKTKGQSLPTIEERGKTYEQMGLGKAGDFQGTTDQNVSLLSRLQSTPPATAPTATAPSPTTGLYGSNLPTRTSLLDEYRKKMGLDTLESTITQGLANGPKKYDIYSQETGALEPQRQQVKSLDDRLATMKSALDASEGDIRKRIIDSGGIVTESQVQRLLAAEKQPLLNEYNSLFENRNRYATNLSTEEARAKEIAGMKYEDASAPLAASQSKYKVLGDVFGQVYGAAEKDLSSRIQAAKDAADVPTSLTEIRGHRVLINSKTGDPIRDLGPTGSTGGTGGTSPTFTTSEQSQGAKTAGLTVADFNALDNDSKKFFITRKSEIDTMKKKIDEAVAAGEDAISLTTEVEQGNGPAAVKKALLKYVISLKPKQRK